MQYYLSLVLQFSLLLY